MQKFKVGDKVRRIEGLHQRMKKGDIATIIEVKSSGTIYLKEYIHGHDSTKFELVKNYKPKNPTHVVIWEIEGCGDPSRFFTSEKEAKEFVKELSEKSNVRKESIILVAIKSVQNVKVIKNIRLTNYKI